jgi:hypothetical protein
MIPLTLTQRCDDALFAGTFYSARSLIRFAPSLYLFSKVIAGMMS